MGSFNSSQPSSKGSVTYPGQGGQPAMGDPSQSMTMDMPQQYSSNQPSLGKQVQQNQYGNTVGGWDNASIQPQATQGKGSPSGTGGNGSTGKGTSPSTGKGA